MKSNTAYIENSNRTPVIIIHISISRFTFLGDI